MLEVENCDPVKAVSHPSSPGPPCVYLDAQPDCSCPGDSTAAVGAVQERAGGEEDFWAECEAEVVRGQREIERVLAGEERRARLQVAALFQDKQGPGAE